MTMKVVIGSIRLPPGHFADRGALAASVRADLAARLGARPLAAATATATASVCGRPRRIALPPLVVSVAPGAGARDLAGAIAQRVYAEIEARMVPR